MIGFVPFSVFHTYSSLITARFLAVNATTGDFSLFGPTKITIVGTPPITDVLLVLAVPYLICVMFLVVAVGLRNVPVSSFAGSYLVWSTLQYLVLPPQPDYVMFSSYSISVASDIRYLMIYLSVLSFAFTLYLLVRKPPIVPSPVAPVMPQTPFQTPFQVPGSIGWIPQGVQVPQQGQSFGGFYLDHNDHSTYVFPTPIQFDPQRGAWLCSVVCRCGEIVQLWM